jgi:membrane-associated phospholipid phosphatase
MKKIALLISHLLNPALLALLVFVIQGRMGDGFVGYVGVGIFAILPGCTLLVLFRWRYVHQLYPHDRNERSILLLLGGLCYAVGWVVLYRLDAERLVLATAGIFVVSTLLVWLVNRHWKISIHAAGVGGTACILLLSIGEQAAPFFVALPIIAWARLHLRAHTPAQVVAGSALGVGVSLVLFHAFGLSIISDL